MAAKTFLQLQQELAGLHLDTSSAWIAGGANNKQAINDAYEMLWDKLKNSSKIRPYISTQKSAVTITDKIGALPVAFDTVNIVSTEDFASESDLQMNGENIQYHDYEVRGLEGAKSIYIQHLHSTLYISYIPIITALSADGDKPALPPELHRCIAAFALFEYYRTTRENIEAGNALALANAMMNDKLATI